MSISPLQLARSLRLACNRSARVTEISQTPRLAEDGKSASFRVYDNDGGILDVTVVQYKEPIR